MLSYMTKESEDLVKILAFRALLLMMVFASVR
jgi:hypothetical protein